MYQLDSIYSLEAYDVYCRWLSTENRSRHCPRLKPHKQNWKVIRDTSLIVKHWNALRDAVSFLAMMNKRHVLYFRGQIEDYSTCLPTLFRNAWHYRGTERLPLSPARRREYFALLQGSLRQLVNEAILRFGTPREYILRAVPEATASILQHYELWPTPFIDVTRSLPTAVAFATQQKTPRSFLYVFAMPDLRGSITTDLDQHLTLSRLEALCPPSARRPHHQDAYLVGRAPMPHDSEDDRLWEEWESRSDLLRRVVIKFELATPDGVLPGTPAVPHDHLIPTREDDPFHQMLGESVCPSIERFLRDLRS